MFSVNEVTRIGIPDHSHQPVSPVPLGGPRRFPGTFVQVGNIQYPCGDTYPRTLRVLTPATCAIWDGAQDRSTLPLVGNRHEFHLRGLALGDCAVSLSLDGTAPTLQKTFGVVSEP